MLEELFLLRLFAATDPSRGETRSRVAADLRPYAGREEFAAAAGRLAQAGHLEGIGRGGGRLRVTEAGRTRARTAFGVPADASSGRKGWAWWRDRFAVPRALGMRRVDSAEALRAALLRRLYLPELPASAAAGNLRATVDLLLAKRLRTAQPGAGAFRQAALRAWVRGEPKAKPAPAAPPPDVRLPEDLPGFAERVRAASRSCPTGRFGDNKVFISHVWNALVASGVDGGQERAFKERLVRANTAGLLRLSRADLAGTHVAGDVRASETPYLGEVFHFIRLD